MPSQAMSVSSREKLDMDNERAPNNLRTSTLTMDRKRGFFVEPWALFVVVVITVATVAGVALLVLFLVPCSCAKREPTRDAEDAASRDSAPEWAKKPIQERLPSNLVPVSYSVELQPFISHPLFSFDGNVTILINCMQETHNITLHINDLIIYNETVQVKVLADAATSEGSTPRTEPARSELLESPKSLAYDVERQFFTIQLHSNLQKGRSYLVSMRFKGNLNDDLVGFYRSSYNDSDTGEQRWLAVTQFQPTDARRAFPCFDEPALKATFNITLIHWKNMSAISNMPLEDSQDRGEWVVDRFQTTVNMSTYLLAFVVGSLSKQEDKTVSPAFAVWSRPNTVKAAERALYIGPKILKHYETFFNTSFPLPKTDMVAVPDFNAGAMENWGLIIYRETAMLFDPKVASAYNLQRVATVVAHELAHQWFGNLVTPKWWDDLWLNEGFASYMEYEGVDSVFPKWKMHEQFVVDEVQDVFELDCLTSSHPISVKVNHPDEINEIFDRISYGKGASIIRMMSFLLGSKTFQRGVSNYLKALKFSNAEQNDLWGYLTEAQKQGNESRVEMVDVKKVMDSWTLQVVTLTRNYKEKKADLRQERFLLASSNRTNNISLSEYLWEIPITYTSRFDPQPDKWEPVTKLWMHKDQKNLIPIPEKDVASSEDWMIVNIQEVGYYRVNYDIDNWKMLIKQLQTDHHQLHVVNRAQILDDAQDLARAGLLHYSVALDATEYLSKEEGYIPWEAATAAFSFLDKMLRRTALYGEWKQYVLSLILPLYDKVGWVVADDDQDILRQYTQYTGLSWACKYEYEPCINRTRSLFSDWKVAIERKRDNPVNPNLRSFVYCTAIEYGNEDDWNFTWKQYLLSEDASEKDKLMRSLACTREPWLLRRYVDWSFNESSGIRRQDGSYVFRSVAANNYGRDLAFTYLREQWDKIVKYYGKSFFSFGTLIKASTSSLNTHFELQQLKVFYGKVKRNVGTAQRSFRQSIEQAEANAEWLTKYYSPIAEWISKRPKRSH